MSNNKQSSVEWLIHNLYLKDSLKWQEVIEQAKAMHQEEVEDFTFEWYRQKTMTINEFYNKTFGGNNV